MRALVWVGQGFTVPSATVPAIAPTFGLQLPYNPLALTNVKDTLYVFSHSSNSSVAIDWMGTSLGLQPLDEIKDLGAFASFPCPPNAQNQTQSLNVCTVNSNAATGYLLDQTQDPLAVVGVFSPTQAAQVSSAFSGRDFREELRAKGELWEDIQAVARAARDMSHAPEAFLQAHLGEVDSAAMLSVAQCPNGAETCAPMVSSNAQGNFNYNSVASACPLYEALDCNIQNCLLRGEPVAGNVCPGNTLPTTLNLPVGACDNAGQCTAWLNFGTAGNQPTIARSCQRLTSIGTGTVLGPLMPGFNPSPAACAQPAALGASGCVSLLEDQTQALCNVAGYNAQGYAQYTSECYNPTFPAGTYCDAGDSNTCQAPTGAYYSSQTPCATSTPSDFQGVAACRGLPETPTMANATSSGFFPFAQLPCAAGLQARVVSSFPNFANPSSNQLTCPQATSDEASWYQTVFTCVPPDSYAGANAFGQTVLPPPVPGDQSGASVVPDSFCAAPPALNPGWSAACSQDAAGNNQVLFTYDQSNAGGTISQMIYPQACLDPGRLAAGAYANFSAKGVQPTEAQLAQCTTSDCASTMAQLLVTKSSGGYVPAAPAGATSMPVCGVIAAENWAAPYEACTDAGGCPAGSVPAQLSYMATGGAPLQRVPYGLANLFTGAQPLPLGVTGRGGEYVPI